jgi:NAD(P)-dependent dehydrogenase (short-subunit alcohol dehydrogenase family)
MNAPAPDHTGRGLDSLMRMDGRGAVVTGGANGLGLAIAQRLAEQGAGVILADLDLDAAEAAAERINASGGRAAAALVDVRDSDQVSAAADQAIALFGGLHVWVNNAGIFPPADPVDATTEEFDEIMRVNVTGVHHGCQAAVRRMKEFGGVIVNLSSTGGYRGAGAYSASKWAIRGITQGLAGRVGRDGIRVVGVAPTLVVTPGTSRAREKLGPFMEGLAASLPLGRVGVPDDIARVVAFLASDAAAFVTGITVPVDGGELSH